jgi:hypothetical protein
LGVKIYTRFSDNSLLISTSYPSRAVAAPSSGITKNFVSRIPAEVWLSHKKQVLDMEAQGKTITHSGSLSDFIDFCDRQNDLSQYMA